MHSHRGCASFLVQRQSRRMGMQILSLSHLSLHQITDKLCAAINQSESYGAEHCQNYNTSPVSFYKNDRGHFSATTSSCVSNHPRFLCCITPLYSPHNLCLC